MRVGYNISAITAKNTLAKTDDRLAKSLERLSSGLKINHAKDNPAGVAISRRMNSQIRGLSVAGDNASDGISIVETADGALNEIHDMLNRMTELAVDAANGTKTDEDRSYLDEEIQQLKEEITRIAKDTEFNGQPLLDGGFDLRAYSSNSNVGVMYYSDEVQVKDYTISSVTTELDEKGNTVIKEVALLQDGSENSFPQDAYVSEIDGDTATIKASGGFEVKITATKDATDVNLDMTGIGAMRMQIGTMEGQVLEIRIPTVSLKHMGMDDLSIATQEDAALATGAIAEAQNYISAARSRLGAYQNRLESATESLDINHENMTSAYSRIVDVDMAEEMTEYTNQQVLSQAGTSMLVQANERPQQVLQLLQ
ncbi:MAG: flagellin FliC3 [Lachnospiraceae bacterium]|nr:flagellin FliC3 [Lachnospiraceae bacterium]